MVTDYQKTIKFLNDFGIGYKEFICESMKEKNIECREGMNKVEGYSFFRVYFVFDKNDKFIRIDIFE